MIRMSDIAVRAGVSRATVSFVLNGKDRSIGISEETRLRAVQAAREQLEGTSSDGFDIDWDELPDRTMFTGETREA